MDHRKLFAFFFALACTYGPASNAEEAPNSSEQIDGAKQVVQQISALRSKTALNEQDQEILDRYRSFFSGVGRVEMTLQLSNPEHPGETREVKVENALSVGSLNSVRQASGQEARNSALERLISALNARIGASTYNPPTVRIGDKTYAVHNYWAQLRERYDSSEINRVLDQLDGRGVFRLYSDPSTGLVSTSETLNPLMRRQWLTDGSMNGVMQREKDPQAWQKVVLVHAAVLNNPEEKSAIDRSIEDPSWYRDVSDSALKNGPFHIFNPHSANFEPSSCAEKFDPKACSPAADKIEGDKDFNRKRLESFALALGDFVDTLKAGFIPDANGAAQPWGLGPDILGSRSFELIRDASVSLARFLMATNTDPETKKIDMAAVSGSSWEEAPFTGGVTSDAAFTVLSFEKLKDLLYNPAYANDPNVVRLRKDFLEGPGGSALSQEKIDQLIAAGRRLIDQRVSEPLEKGDAPMQNPSRKADTSLALLAASDYRFDSKDPVRDARIRRDLLDSLQKDLSGESGMRRYNPFELRGEQLHDSYLNMDYEMPPALRAAAAAILGRSEDRGSTDASSIEALKDRQALSRPEFAAQWGLGVSASLQGYAKAKQEILESISSHGEATPGEQRLLAQIDAGINDSINRNVALISGRIDPKTPVVLSDGSPAPENKVMEAYEIVHDLSGTPKWVPGQDTLAWGTSQLYDGLRLAQKAQNLEEKLQRQSILQPESSRNAF